MIRFRCPACHESLSASNEMTGAAISCRSCGASLLVPTEAPPAGSTTGDDNLPEADMAPVRFGREKIPPEELDMTPMVDVTFLLLIFFMVTATFTMQKTHERSSQPDQQPSTQVKNTLEEFEKDPEWVIVRIDGYNTYHVFTSGWDEYREAPSHFDMRRILRQTRTADSGPTRLLIVANEACLHDHVIQAQDAGMAVGMNEVKRVMEPATGG